MLKRYHSKVMEHWNAEVKQLRLESREETAENELTLITLFLNLDVFHSSWAHTAEDKSVAVDLFVY